MKIGEGNKLHQILAEMEAELAQVESARMDLTKTLASDAYAGAVPKAGLGDDASVSSVAPRVRSGCGDSLVSVLAGQTVPDPDDLSWIFKGPKFTPTKGPADKGTVTSGMLIDYYDDSMTALHDALNELDHNRGESLFFDRYYFDMWQHHEDSARRDAALAELEARRRDEDDYNRRNPR